ncbi:ABC transporter substrate-binding protein [Streptomyces albidoflavus]|uniref:ABC transporter substrate-binding protein n=1 Tax=Streptomyces albidoflavus TaxID=1886 RepID=A0A8G1ZTM7_9ACTN|nr:MULTISPECIES: ABC transporter substrate-binding protein [Streptomyces]KUL56455.1 ABC transporter substrate-binding protein [Streptomyces albidoflavus]MEE1722055.1 ABC transporter substrate-binding protein [Streptomyces sp. JV186]RZE27231.1 ABC transporter substrate-binding protein [Streptomyces albidoflavus]RZE47428.1 ABC transporter substrate-binding protein [Streptomyces albidoflavus]WSU14772.1 ABC transporter substrate-binding protein [Streptomyces albidoflavus]
MDRPEQHGSSTNPRTRRGRLRLLAASGVAAMSLTAGLATPLNPAPHEAEAADGGKKTLTVAVAQSVDSLSPFLAQTLVSTSIHRLMYDFLTNYDAKDNSTVPAMATEWESSDDKLTWTYTIRSDAKWSDGEKVTAEDAAWTFNTMMEDEAAATANGSFTSNFKKVTAPGPDKLVVELKKPQATMTALDVPIVPKHVWEKVDDFSKFNNDQDFPVVGNGPFVLTEYKRDSYVKLTANKDYWRGAPKFDELVFRYYKDQDAAVAALRKGEVSFAAGSPSLTPAQANSLAKADNIKVNEGPGRRFFALAVNPGARTKDGEEFGDGHPALQDAKVREALFTAVDRETIVDRVFQGNAVEGEGYIPPRFGDYFWKPSAEQKRAYDPAKAAELLDDAGYEKNAEGKRVGKDGKPLDFRILCHATDPNDKAVGKYLQEWWGELGIGLKVDCLDNVSDPWAAGEYDLAFDGWSVNPDPDFVLGIHTCAALPNKPKESSATDNFICDKEFDKLYGQQLAEYDPAKRADLVKQMQSRLYDTGYMNVLAYPNAVEAYRTDQIKSITTMPQAAGNIYGQDGYWSWWSAVPADDDAGSEGSGGLSTGAMVGIGVAAVLAIGAGVLFGLRRRATAEDRE